MPNGCPFANRQRTRSYYERAQAGVHPCASTFIEWLDSGESVESPLPLAQASQPDVIRNLLREYSAPGVQWSRSYSRGIQLLREFVRNESTEIKRLWHSVKTAYDAVSVGWSAKRLTSSISNVGPLHNCTDESGIPIAGLLRARNHNEAEGWMDVVGIRYSDGVFDVIGTPSGPLPPMINCDDIDVALKLAFFERLDLNPSFSLEDARHPAGYELQLNRKEFTPAWLGNTSFGQSMFLADWIMKALTMRDGLPSISDPFISGAGKSGWRPTAIMEAVGNFEGDFTVPPNDEILHGRLEIVAKNVTLRRASYVSRLSQKVVEYAMDDVQIKIESSLYRSNLLGRREHFRSNDPLTDPGGKAKVIEDNYNYLTSEFPVFQRVRLLLGIYSVFRQFRREGLHPSASEELRLMRKFSTVDGGDLGDWEYCPKAFHKDGCTCSGGVSASGEANVASNQTSAFGFFQDCVNFLVSASGFVSPVPDEAGGPHQPYGKGVAFTGGSGGHGFAKEVSSVYVLDANSNQGARTYYRNAAGHKVNPFTGKQIRQDDPLAHMYHA